MIARGVEWNIAALVVQYRPTDSLESSISRREFVLDLYVT